MELKYFLVDAFTNSPFKGNPAAVFILHESLEENLMQQIAGELNMPATAFLYQKQKNYFIRWFAPKLEIKLCGHGTLAAAHILFKKGIVPASETIVFETHFKEQLTASTNTEDIYLTLPSIAVEEEVKLEEKILEALKSPEILFSGLHKNGYIIELSSDTAVRELKPDFNFLATIPKVFIVTAKSDNSSYDIVSRVFVPFAGTNEDPVTGSAHALLGPYWGSKMGKKNIRAFQASARGGDLSIENDEKKVIITSSCITIAEGNFILK